MICSFVYFLRNFYPELFKNYGLHCLLQTNCTAYFIFFLSISLLHGQSSSIQSLTEIIQNLEKKHQIHFAYDPDICSQYYSSIEFYSDKLTEQLEELVFQTPFKLVKQDKTHFLLIPDTEKERSIKENGKYSLPILVKGNIKDFFTQENLIGVTVVLLPDGVSTDTDVSGNYYLKSSTKYSRPWVEFRYLGYEVQRKKIMAGSDTSINELLIPNLSQLEPIEVSAISTVKSISNFPHTYYYGNLGQAFIQNTFNDPIRQLQQISGINATDDASAQLQIRGSNSDENQIQLDEMNLYSIDHFYGVISSIHPSIVSQADVYKSYFPAEYGGKTSSYVLLKTQPLTKKLKGNCEISLLNTSGFMQVPIYKGSDIQLSGRISNSQLGESGIFQSLLNSNEIVEIERGQNDLIPIQPLFWFYDIYGKYRTSIGANANLYAAFFRSKDRVSSRYISNSQAGNRMLREFYQDSAEWNNSSYNIGFEHNWKNAGKSQFDFNQFVVHSNLNIYSEVRTMIGMEKTVNREFTQFENSLIIRQLKFTHKLAIKNIDITTGADMNFFETKTIARVDRFILYSDSLRTKYDLSFFINSKIPFGKKWSLEPGLRISNYEVRKKLDWSPRLSLTYTWNEKIKTSLRAGIYYQYLRQANFEDRFGRTHNYWVQANEFRIPTSRSIQIEGVQNFLIDNGKVSIECFYKHIDGIVEQVSEFNFLTPDSITSRKRPRYLTIIGTSKLWGAELNIGQQLKFFTYNFSYSYLHASNSFASVNNGSDYPVPYSREHQLKLQQALTWRGFILELFGVYGSGQPYTNLALVKDEDRFSKPIKETTSYLPDYYRFDVDLRYTYGFRKYKMEFGISVLNLLDRDNVKYVQYVYNIPQRGVNPGQSPENKIVGSEVQLLGRTINVYVGVRF